MTEQEFRENPNLVKSLRARTDEPWFEALVSVIESSHPVRETRVPPTAETCALTQGYERLKQLLERCQLPVQTGSDDQKAYDEEALASGQVNFVTED